MEDPKPETIVGNDEINQPVAKPTTDIVDQLSIKEPDTTLPVSEDMDIDVELDDSNDDTQQKVEEETKSNKRGGTSKRGKTGKTVATPRIRKPRGKKATPKDEAEDAQEVGERVVDEQVEGNEEEVLEEEEVKPVKKRAPAKRKPAVPKTPKAAKSVVDDQIVDDVVEGNEEEAFEEEEEEVKPVKKRAPAKRKPAAPKTPKEPAAKRSRKKAQATETPDSIDKDAAEDGIVDESTPKPKKKRAPAKRKGTAAEPAVGKGKAAVKCPQYDPEYVRELERANTGRNAYWQHYASPRGEPCDMISEINEHNPLKLMNVDMRDEGAITGMTLSPDGTMLVTFCNLGAARIWDVETFKLIRTLRDAKEPQIDEMYVGKFTPDCTKIAIGGKLKDRHNWSEVDDDNHILNCPLKIFDTVTGEVISRLDGHTEEIICVKLVRFKDENYYITTSQDGHIIKWRMESDYSTLIEQTKMDDGLTCMAFTVSFAPGTGNKYFLAACDDNLRLYDFEEAKLLQTFENIYSQYCDCGKFVECVDLPTNLKNTSDDDDEGDEKGIVEFAYFVSRGVEEYLDLEDIASRPNTCTLHKLVYPTKKGGQFKLEEVRRYQDKDYVSNSWLIKISSNGRYLMAPGMNGQVVSFNLETGNVTAVLRDHEDLEIRDVIFHPTKKLLFTSGDDGCVKVYTQTPVEAVVVSEESMGEVAVEALIVSESVSVEKNGQVAVEALVVSETEAMEVNAEEAV